jgi:hypothetical protein
MVGTPAHLATARDVVARARAESAAQLDAHGKDAVILSIPGAEGVQSWRAGLYAKVDAPPAGHPPLLYKRVRDRPGEQDSFLYTLPDRGMWLVGSTPGSTLCANQPVSWDVGAKLQNSLARSNRSRFG